MEDIDRLIENLEDMRQDHDAEYEKYGDRFECGQADGLREAIREIKKLYEDNISVTREGQCPKYQS